MSHLWGGRFEERQDQFFSEFNASFRFDQRLVFCDIEGSRAYAKGLLDVGVLSADEESSLQTGLNQIESKLHNNPDFLKSAVHEGSYEDVHAFVEAELFKLCGDAAKKLHTGRSRNDQVATDLRLYLRHSIDTTVSWLKALQKSLVERAKENPRLYLPGYTHLQKAQPVLWSHLLLSYVEMLSRDVERLSDCRKRVNVLPLGSGALSGNSQGVDRELLASELSFDEITRNSLDATSDRDFVVEYLSAAALAMMHLSRLSEDLIIYATDEFRFVEMSDKVATGSSLMPQKKNPDALELVRGKTGRVYGNLMGMLTTLKGLPSCYNKDLQEDKEALFDTIDTLIGSTKVMCIVIDSLKVNVERMSAACKSGYLNATELADYLVKKGIPFRSAHHKVGEIVVYAIKHNKPLDELSLEEYKSFDPLIDADVFDRISMQATLASKASFGGTAPSRVAKAIHEASERLEASSEKEPEDD